MDKIDQIVRYKRKFEATRGTTFQLEIEPGDRKFGRRNQPHPGIVFTVSPQGGEQAELKELLQARRLGSSPSRGYAARRAQTRPARGWGRSGELQEAWLSLRNFNAGRLGFIATALVFEPSLLRIEISFFRWLSLVRGLDFGNVVFFVVRRQTGAVEISFAIFCGLVLCVIHVSPLRHLSHLANSGGNTLD
jgi:hypothetical protein